MPSTVQQILVVGAGGCIGAISRFALSGAMQRLFPKFPPAGTLLVNVAGCLAIGALMACIMTRPAFSPATRAFLLTGFLGSLTTFSTFGYETFEYLRESNLRLAFWNVAANLVLGLAAVAAGYALGRQLFR